MRDFTYLVRWKYSSAPITRIAKGNCNYLELSEFRVTGVSKKRQNNPVG